MKYKIILVDPPWQYNDKSMNRGGAERHYKTMSLAEMSRLNVAALADTNESALCMWVTFPHLETAMGLIKSWGFTSVTCLFNWVKLNKRNQTPEKPFVGMGHYTRSNAEIMLLARRGKTGRIPKRQTASIRQIQYFPVTAHSAKPPEFRDLLVELFGDVPRVELFAREAAPGWDAWGNEVESSVSLLPKPFATLDDSIAAMLKTKKPNKNDLRAICPDCFEHIEVGSVNIMDGGSYVLQCDCGYKQGSLINDFKTSITEIYKELKK